MIDQIYAEIIVDSKCRETDRIYTYMVPENLNHQIKVGSRVLVPFGISNKKTEAYVIGLKQNPQTTKHKLKQIIKLLDDEPVLTHSMIELVKWIKEKYLCFYIDAVQTVIPAPVRVKSTYVIELNNGADIEALIGKSGTDKLYEIIEYIELNGGAVLLSELKKYFSEVKIEYYTKKLFELGIAEKKQYVKNKVNSKVIKHLYPVEGAVSNFHQNAHKQKKVYEYIKKSPGVSLDEAREALGDIASLVNLLCNKGYVKILEKDAYRYNHSGEAVYRKPVLTIQQLEAIQHIEDNFQRERNVLLHGVTGSGKTEVYMEIIDKNLKEGKDAIILVPEISLTPQMIERFRGRFGDNIAVLHSNLSEGEKYDEWRKIRSGLVKLAVGARSAVFAPFSKLGVIIIDEEHENTYKSEIKPKYLTREVAEKRCQMEGAKLILGSATPSVETYYRADIGELGLVRLPDRVNNRPMPKVEIVDMREELKKGNKTIFSERLTEQIIHTLNSDNQLILFLNRRGYSTFVSCRQCGLVMKCPRCSISMTYHMYSDKLTCHYCGYERSNPKTCPKCSSTSIRYFGVGTQKLEKEFQARFGVQNTLRMDADTTNRKNSHEKILSSFRRKEAKVLLGTQMISKGLDFHDVTLVGVITADTSLNLPDFRASERTFQMIAQVAGRAGRGEKQGCVIVQTYSPEHYSLQYAQKHDYEGFYQQEIRLRKELSYPPFSFIAGIIISGLNKEKVERASAELGSFIASENMANEIEILGPAAAPLSRIKNRHRWQLILKSRDYELIRGVLHKIIYSNDLRLADVNVSIDMNPYNML
ncbi:MAG: primosomal protein N' [Bacillota bacterium]